MKMRDLALLPLLAGAALLQPLTCAQAPVFAISPSQSTIRFSVSSSIEIAGKFDKWSKAATR